ncbi:hypothetical protein CHUAL_011185 [Chamberlinius hualienensis]
MSTTELKKSRRRKNKPKGDNSKAKLANTISSNLLERMMDDGENPLSLFNISSGSNPFFSSEKCLVCHREKDEESLEDGGILPYDVPNMDALPLYICNDCRGNPSPTKLTKMAVTSTDEINDYFIEPEGTCSCLSYEKNYRNLKNYSPQSDESLRQLSAFVKLIFKDGGIDWTREKNHCELKLLDKLKQMIERWCITSCQDSFVWLQCHVKDYIEELKSNLLGYLKGNVFNLAQAKMFMNDLLEGYARLCCASKRLKPVVAELEKHYLSKMSLNWEFVNRRLFYSVIYADEHIQALLPSLLHQLNSSKKVDKEQNVTSILQRYLKLDEQMKKVSGLCNESESFAQDFHKSQHLIRNKLRCIRDDADSITVKQKFEHHLIKRSDGGIHSGCSGRSSVSSGPSHKSTKSSMTNGADAAKITERLRNKSCQGAFGLPFGISSDDVNNLAMLCRTKSCGGFHTPMMCNNSASSHIEPGEREPGDGASENSTLFHSSRTYFDENFKDQCHTCSLVTNVGGDHVVEPNDASKEKPTFETPCECHVCVQHADRATIPTIINSPLPAALHLYPHIHGTNTEHSINPHFVKPILHSHVHEVYTSVSTTKNQSQDDPSVKCVGKSAITGNVMDGLKAECCKSKILQFSKNCTQSQDYKTLVTKESTETQKIIRRSTQTVTSNVSVKTQTQASVKNDESTCSKCVTKNKAVQATSGSCWPQLFDHHIKNHYNHPSASPNGNGSCAKKDADSANCINECRHNVAKSNIRPAAEDTKNKTVHSCGHHNGHMHINTSKSFSKESRCGIRESQSLSPTRPSSDVEHLRSGDGEDCLDDSCSERSSSTSTSNTKDAKQTCDCCYCEVFGPDVTTIPSTNRHYTEYRDRLRQRLSRKKEYKTSETVEPITGKKKPQEDDRDLESLINYINGDKSLENDSSTFDNSPKKLPKMVKKLNKKFKKVDRLEDRVDGKDISIDIPGRNYVGNLDEIFNSCLEMNNVPNYPYINNLNELIREKDHKCEKVLKDQNHCNTGNKSVKNKEPSEVYPNRIVDKKKRQLASISPVAAKLSIIETKASLEEQTSVPNSKLKKQLPYQNHSESLSSVRANSSIATSTSSLSTRSPSPTVNHVQDYLCHLDKSTTNKLKSGPSEQSPRKLKNSKDKKKLESANAEKKSRPPSCISSESFDVLSTQFNGIYLQPDCPSPSPSVIEQSKKRKAKKKQLPAEIGSPIDEVFIPRDIDLDNGELDETERELEEFKRFCWDSVPVPHEEKIRVNLKDLKLSKKNVLECS